jgi:hypothetical protein
MVAFGVRAITQSSLQSVGEGAGMCAPLSARAEDLEGKRIYQMSPKGRETERVYRQGYRQANRDEVNAKAQTRAQAKRRRRGLI